MLASVRGGLELVDPQITFNICRFLRRAVEGEAVGAGGTSSKNVRLEILKFDGLLELLVQTATGNEVVAPRQAAVSAARGSAHVTETLAITSPRSVDVEDPVGGGELEVLGATMSPGELGGSRLGTAESRLQGARAEGSTVQDRGGAQTQKETVPTGILSPQGSRQGVGPTPPSSSLLGPASADLGGNDLAGDDAGVGGEAGVQGGRRGGGVKDQQGGSVTTERAKLEAYLVIQTCIEPGFFMAHPGQAGLDCRRIRAFHRL